MSLATHNASLVVQSRQQRAAVRHAPPRRRAPPCMCGDVAGRSGGLATDTPQDSVDLRRRALLALGAAAATATLSVPRDASAAPASARAPPEQLLPGGWKLYTGYAMQPDLYLGQGYNQPVNYEDEPKYTFEYPHHWNAEPVSKTDKSTMGVDGIVRDPKSKRTKAFVVALGGKDYAMARLTDSKQALQAMAGGDPDLREAVSNASGLDAAKRVIDGVETYCYDIPGDKAHYLAKVAVKDHTVFGLFVTTPVSKWQSDQDGMRHVYDSFKLL